MTPIHPNVPALMKRRSNPTGRDADPRRAIPLNSAAWQRLRALILDDEPLCRYCWEAGQMSRATDVDHINGDPSDNSRENLQGLCHECHSTKTMRERHGKPAVTGCDVNGYPLDPNHPWSKVCDSLKSLEADRARPPGNSSVNSKSEV